MASSTTFPHPASVGNLDHCAKCGRHIPPDEPHRDRVYENLETGEVFTARFCSDELKPSAQQRKGIEINAAANARGGGFQVITTTPAEAKLYDKAFTAAKREQAPRRNGSSGRPRAQASRSSSRSGDSGDSSDEPPLPPLRALGSGRLRHVSHGVERLLRKLAVGLDDQALERAAQLVVLMDEDAAARLGGVAA
jgi:hypothetical protein